MFEYKITEIIEAGLYTKDGEKVMDLSETTLKDIFQTLTIEDR